MLKLIGRVLVVCRGYEELDVAFVILQRFWPAIARGQVFDCAKLAHGAEVSRVVKFLRLESFAALDGGTTSGVDGGRIQETRRGCNVEETWRS